MDIEELNLSTRAFNVLKRNHIDTVESLIENYDKLLQLKNCGKVTFEEIDNKIKFLTSKDKEDECEVVDESPRFAVLIMNGNRPVSFEYNGEFTWLNNVEPIPFVNYTSFRKGNSEVRVFCNNSPVIYINERIVDSHVCSN